MQLASSHATGRMHAAFMTSAVSRKQYASLSPLVLIILLFVSFLFRLFVSCFGSVYVA